jgi:hypothetical protein
MAGKAAPAPAKRRGNAMMITFFCALPLVEEELNAVLPHLIVVVANGGVGRSMGCAPING